MAGLDSVTFTIYIYMYIYIHISKAVMTIMTPKQLTTVAVLEGGGW